MTNFQSNAIKTANAHGFDAIPAGHSCVWVMIPYYNSATKESGIEPFLSADWGGIKKALGY